MTIPYRRWTRFEQRTLEAFYASPPGTVAVVGNWTETMYYRCMVGDENLATASDYRWYGLFRPIAGTDFQSRDGMDEVMSIEFNHVVIEEQDTSNLTSFQMIHGIVDNDNAWDKNRVNGKYYDGVNVWDSFPAVDVCGGYYDTIATADLPAVYNPWFPAYKAGIGAWANSKQADFFRGCAMFYAANYSPDAPGSGEIFRAEFQPCYLKVRYFNAVVNSMDRFWAPTTGGVALVLTGLGFKNANAEIDENGPTNPGGWGDLVDNIYFEGLQGQGSTTLTRSAGDFTVDSNTQITIPSGKFPALDAGSYSIKLRKVMSDVGPNVESYAGDWRCATDGLVTEGERLSIYISDTYVAREHREKKGPILLTDWMLKDKTGTGVNKYYSMAYVRCADKVYKGNLLRISSIPRGMEDKTGLFKTADVTLDLANNDLEFSKLLAGTTVLKNRMVKVYQQYLDEPYGWRSHVITMFIDDYDLNDEIFTVKLKDVTQKYFKKKVPQYLCEEAEFSNIHPDKKGAAMPEVLGLCSRTTGEKKGQVEAICINTATFKYLAARRSLKSIDQVYVDNVLEAGGNWSVSYEDGGRTYITFTGDKGDAKITYNCKGYAYGGLNSSNGYVQNPVYVILYYLLVIMGIPFHMINFDSFEDLAEKHENMSEDESGKLILQKQRGPDEVLREMLPGGQCYVGKDGKISIKKKDISNYQTNEGEDAPVVFKQIDVIGKSSREYNMDEAINVIDARYDYIPTHDLFHSHVKDERQNIIDEFEEEAHDRHREFPLEV